MRKDLLFLRCILSAALYLLPCHFGRDSLTCIELLEPTLDSAAEAADLLFPECVALLLLHTLELRYECTFDLVSRIRRNLCFADASDGNRARGI